MQFNIGQIISSSTPERSGRTRWRVLASQSKGKVTLLGLTDNSVSDPLRREVVGATIDLFNRGQGYDVWHSMAYKRQFEEACSCAAANVAGLPELIDYFSIRNTDPNVPEDVAREMPFVVYHYSDFTPVSTPYWIKKEEHLHKNIKKLAYQVGFTMRALNQRGIAIRQVLPQNLRSLKTTGGFVLAEFFAACRFSENRQQYDPHRPHLILNPLYAAPECFSEAELTPATDVFALAVLLLLYLGAQINKPITCEEQVIAHLSKIEKQFKFAFRESVVRAFKMALKKDPRLRLREFGEFITMFNGKQVEQRKPQQRIQSTKPKERHF